MECEIEPFEVLNPLHASEDVDWFVEGAGAEEGIADLPF
jgi:hypothetical protein